MLTELRVRDLATIADVTLAARPRPQRAHRRDRRRQVDAGRRARAAARRAGGERQRPSRRRQGDRRRRVRGPRRPHPAPGRGARPRRRGRARRRAARGLGRGPLARVGQRQPDHRRRCSASSARSWWTSTASTRPSRCCTPTPSATSSTPSRTRSRSGRPWPRRTPRSTALRDEEASLASRRDEVRRRADYLRHVVHEIEQARLKPGEDEALQVEARRLSQAGALGEQAQRIVDALEGDAGQRARRAGRGRPRAGRAREGRSRRRRLARAARRGVHQSHRARPAGRDVRRRGRGGSRAAGRGRAAARPALQAHREVRRQRSRPCWPRATQSAAELDLLDTADVDLRALGARRAGAESALRAAADALSAKRADAADRLARGVNRLLPQLGLPGGKLLVSLAPLAEPAAHGQESVHFDVQLNVGLEAKPLARVASGGELSRLMLALKVVLARHDAIADAGLRRGGSGDRRRGRARRSARRWPRWRSGTRCW